MQLLGLTPETRPNFIRLPSKPHWSGSPVNGTPQPWPKGTTTAARRRLWGAPNTPCHAVSPCHPFQPPPGPSQPHQSPCGAWARPQAASPGPLQAAQPAEAPQRGGARPRSPQYPPGSPEGGPGGVRGVGRRHPAHQSPDPGPSKHDVAPFLPPFIPPARTEPRPGRRRRRHLHGRPAPPPPPQPGAAPGPAPLSSGPPHGGRA